MKVRTVFIRLTDNCTLRCKHCYASSAVQGKNELTAGQWIEALHKISEHTNRVTLLGGEPTIIPGYRHILEAATHLFESVTIQTNAVVVPYKALAQIEAAHGGPAHNLTIAVSIEGPEELNDEIRGKNTYQEAWSGIKAYQHEGYKVGIRITATKHLDPQYITHLIKKVIPHNLEKPVPVTIVRFLEKGRGTKEWTPTKQQLQQLYETIKKLQDEGHAVDMFDAPYYAEHKLQEYGEHFKEKGICEVMRSERINIEPNGEITPCFMLTNKQHNMGNILETPWNQIQQNLVNYAETQHQKPLSKECSNCKHVEHCQGGCNYLSTTKRQDPTCPIKTQEVE